MKKLVLGISVGCSLLISLILSFVITGMSGSLSSQQAAKRWSENGGFSQISCFFSVNSYMSEDRIIEFGHSIDGALAEASIVQNSENPSARLWVDAYSASGTLSISTEKARISSAAAIGVGGDFFLFHPMDLLYGSYFSGDSLMQDYCIIDEDAAWQLYGSNNVAGMMVDIGGIPHVIAGVIRREEGHLAEAAGLDSTLVYVSYQTLEEHGRSNGINHYEILMPNPITGFALDYVTKNLGSDEQNVEVIENTSRFSLLSRLKSIKEFGIRSMNGKAIIYPYWENIARGYEEILATLTLLQVLFLLCPAITAAVLLVIWWRNKSWTVKEVFGHVKDKAERRVEKVRANRKREREEFFIAEYEDAPLKSKKDKSVKRKQKSLKNRKAKRRKEDVL